MDHSELVQEMTLLEKLPAQERLKQAKRRRQEQLIEWKQREDEMINNNDLIHNELPMTETKDTSNQSTPIRTSSVQFPTNIILLDATMRQDVSEVRRLLQSGKYNPNSANDDGLTPIHQCSIDNCEQILELLLEYGADVNAKDRDLWTPLHAAATCGHTEICKILIENDADLLALNIDGNMPYDVCDDEVTLDYIETEMDRIGITQEMIDRTRSQLEHQMLADLQELMTTISLSSDYSVDDILSYRNGDGATLLHIAAANGYQTVVEYLLRHGVALNRPDADGWTAIHAAAYWCQQSILTQLIQAGADIYEKVPDGRSALDLCDDPDIRVHMIDVREQCLENHQKDAENIVPTEESQSTTEIQQLADAHTELDASSILSITTSRSGSQYESRSGVSTTHSSGSSLNRSNSIRRASMRDRDRAKKLNENILHVLQVTEQIQKQPDENISNNINLSKKTPDVDQQPIEIVSNESEDSSTTTTIELPPLKISLPPVIIPQTPAETLSDVKRRREERRREAGGPFAAISPPLLSPPVPPKILTDTSQMNGNHRTIINDTTGKYFPKKFFEWNGFTSNDDDEKRICCTIL